MSKHGGSNKEQRAPAKVRPEAQKTAKQEKRKEEVAEKRQASMSKLGKMGGEKGAAGVRRNMVLVIGGTRPNGTWSGKMRWRERGYDNK
jgi:hypothetical protein